MNAEQVVRVTAQSFAQYRDDLIVLLLDAVGHGASVGFMNDLDQPQASRYFNEVHAQLEQGNLLLWVLVEDQRVLQIGGRAARCVAQPGDPAHFVAGRNLRLQDRSRAEGIARMQRERMVEHMEDAKHGAAYSPTGLTPRQWLASRRGEWPRQKGAHG